MSATSLVQEHNTVTLERTYINPLNLFTQFSQGKGLTKQLICFYPQSQNFNIKNNGLILNLFENLTFTESNN